MTSRRAELEVYWTNMLLVRPALMQIASRWLMPDFPQEGFEKQDPLPFVELQYPAKGCREK